MKNYVGFVIDRSSSMESIQDEVVNTFNKLVSDIKRDSKGQNTKISLLTFADDTNLEFHNLDVKELRTWKKADYNPYGWTALRDGVSELVEMLNNVKDASDEDVSFLIVVITDGCENRSRDYSKTQLTSLLRSVQSTGRWTITFNVPPGNKDQIVRELGIPEDNVREWEATKKGIDDTYVSNSLGVSTYFGARSRGVRSLTTFYAKTNLENLSKRDVQKNLEDLSREFKVFEVPKECAIKEFVESKMKRPYELGQAYYELTKKEKIQSNKELLVMEKGKSTIWGGDNARELLGLDFSGDVKVEPGNHANYNIFCQSTSVNRKLVRGTKVLVKI